MKSFLSLTNILMVTIVVGCISLLLFSDRGLINLWSLKKEKLEIQNEINDLRNQIAMLEKEQEKLKFDEKYTFLFFAVFTAVEAALFCVVVHLMNRVTKFHPHMALYLATIVNFLAKNKLKKLNSKFQKIGSLPFYEFFNKFFVKF